MRLSNVDAVSRDSASCEPFQQRALQALGRRAAIDYNFEQLGVVKHGHGPNL